MEDEYILTCKKCKAGFTDNDAEWVDDDENEQGGILWIVYAKCPYCGKENYYEIWDDFSEEIE